ncbi:MAG: radical SAM protein [Candidatus Hydrogenedentes bacterium]|nr:radical SAM protein [Candidatus Hydrogenedentota bacterium]
MGRRNRHRTSPLMQGLRTFLAGRAPGQLVIQYSDACNARCPQCELRATNRFRRSQIPTDEMKRMIDAAVRNGVQALSFTGGEPFLHTDELIELVHYAGEAGIPYIRTGTNAFFLRNADEAGWEARVRGLAEALAATRLYTLWISIDSCDAAVHEEMRGLDGVVRGIERALPIFHECGIYPAANLGINRNTPGRWEACTPDGQCDPEALYELFRTGFARFYRFVTGLGFTMANTCYPMSVEAAAEPDLVSVYGASSVDPVVSFTGQEKAAVFRALLDTIPLFRPELRIFSPLCSVYALARHYGDGVTTGYPCRGGAEFFFVDAKSAHTFPCGFRGSEDLGPYGEALVPPRGPAPACRACDWECFRDPSDLLGPFLELRHNPFALGKRLLADPAFGRLWCSDVRYARACGFFSGRQAPDTGALRRFRGKEGRHPLDAYQPVPGAR